MGFDRGKYPRLLCQVVCIDKGLPVHIADAASGLLLVSHLFLFTLSLSFRRTA